MSGKAKKKHNRMAVPAAICNILGIAVLIAVLAVVLPITVPRFLGYDMFNIVSASMEPKIPVGSIVYVQEIAPEEVEVGDVIAFYSTSGNSVITHRVRENYTVGGEFTTKGDANEDEDPDPVSYDQLIGIVVKSVPKLGSLSAALSTTLGKVYVLGFLLAGALLEVVAARMRDSGRQALEDEEDDEQEQDEE